MALPGLMKTGTGGSSAGTGVLWLCPHPEASSSSSVTSSPPVATQLQRGRARSAPSSFVLPHILWCPAPGWVSLVGPLAEGAGWGSARGCEHRGHRTTTAGQRSQHREQSPRLHVGHSACCWHAKVSRREGRVAQPGTWWVLQSSSVKVHGGNSCSLQSALSAHTAWPACGYGRPALMLNIWTTWLGGLGAWGCAGCCRRQKGALQRESECVLF